MYLSLKLILFIIKLDLDIIYKIVTSRSNANVENILYVHTICIIRIYNKYICIRLVYIIILFYIILISCLNMLYIYIA